MNTAFTLHDLKLRRARRLAMLLASLLMVAAAVTAYLYFQGKSHWQRAQQLQLVVDIWQNCPMPQRGTLLIVESDWEGRAEGEQYRCFHAKKPGRNLRPSAEPKAFDNRCRGGLCV